MIRNQIITIHWFPGSRSDYCRVCQHFKGMPHLSQQLFFVSQMSICPLCELTHSGVLVSSTSTSKLIKSLPSSLQDVNVYETPVSNPDCNQQHLFLKPAGFSASCYIHSIRVKYHENWINLHEKKKPVSSSCQGMLQLYCSHVVICVTIDGHKQENKKNVCPIA